MRIFLSLFVWPLVFSNPIFSLAFTNNDTFNKVDTARINKLLKQGYAIRLSNPTQTIEIGKKAFKASKQIDYTYGMGEAFRIIGIGSDYLNNRKEAMNNYLIALTYFIKINDLLSQAKIYNNIGNLYSSVDPQRAFQYFKKAKFVANKLLNKKLLASVTVNIGNVYFRENKFRAAIEYYKKGLELYRKLNDTTYQVVCKQNIGVMYFQLKKYDTAYPILIETVKNAKELGLIYIIASSDITIAELYIIKNRLDIADSTINEGITLATKIKNNNIVANFRYLKFQIEQKRRNYKLALTTLYTLYKEDSLAHDKGISTQIDLIREQAKADERKRENEILIQKQKLNQVEIIASLTVAILLLISVGLLYNNLKRKGKTNIQLNALNQEIIKQKQIADQINQHLEEIVFNALRSSNLKTPS